MRYLIYFKDGLNDPFYTEWYNYENNYIEGMIVFDLVNFIWTTDGKTWKETAIDNL